MPKHPSYYAKDTLDTVTYGMYSQHDGLEEFEAVEGDTSMYECVFEVPVALAEEYELARKLFNKLNAKVWRLYLNQQG